MKTFKLILVLLLISKTFSFAQSTTWEQVKITRNGSDVMNMENKGEINVQVKKPFGKQMVLREQAIEQLKKDAASKGANIVLINQDEFVLTPVNCVTIIATAYKDNTIHPATINNIDTIETVNWEQVKITRNGSEVMSMENKGEINAQAKKPFGKQMVLREQAIEQLKKDAASKGATIVLINQDEFVLTPVNCVTIIATAYK